MCRHISIFYINTSVHTHMHIYLLETFAVFEPIPRPGRSQFTGSHSSGLLRLSTIVILGWMLLLVRASAVLRGVWQHPWPPPTGCRPFSHWDNQEYLQALPVSPGAKSLPVRTTARLALLPPSHQVWVWPAVAAALMAPCPHTAVEAHVAWCCGRSVWLLPCSGALGSPVPLLETLNLSLCTAPSLHFPVFEMGLLGLSLPVCQ